METAELLFEILRSEVNEELIETELCRDYDPKALYRLAKAHDVMYCVTDALYKVNLLPIDQSMHDAYVKEKMTAVFRTVRIEETIKRIKEALNEAHVSFIPLKGARSRSMYPDNMMRSSCDIDVLVKGEQLGQAVASLVNCGFITDEKRNYHDVSLYYGSVHLELHFSICEDMEDIDTLLKLVWEYADPVSEYEYQERPEFFAYHHLAHMKYHFVHGGCGIRTFLDLYVMRKIGFYDESKLVDLLESVGLITFYHVILDVISVWFEKKPHNELTKKCEEYILHGGTYGAFENSTAVYSSLRGSKIGNAVHMVFPKYESMCRLYPKLSGKKILLPFYYIRRLLEKTFRKSEKNSRNKLKKILVQDQSHINSVGELLTAMGLKSGDAT